MIVKVMETECAPGNDFGTFCQQLELLEIRFARQFGFMRMDTDSRINTLAFLSQSDSAIKCARAISRADGNNRCDSRFVCACNHHVAISVETLSIKMCMRVYEHFWGSSTNVSPDLPSGRASAARRKYLL